MQAVVERIRARGAAAANARLDRWLDHALETADQLDPLEWIEIAPPAAAKIQSR